MHEQGNNVCWLVAIFGNGVHCALLGFLRDCGSNEVVLKGTLTVVGNPE